MPSHPITPHSVVTEQCRRSLARYVSETSGFQLHPWQLLLCDRLQKLSTQTGQRILIHAPPQVGKSAVLSKRLPAWLIWQNPKIRIIIAAYNKIHAGALIDSSKKAALHSILGGAIEWAKANMDDGCFTPERLALNDAQPSLIGVGLDSSFTGKNADLLIVDDPYPNAEASRSDAYNRVVRSFWEETAEPRLMANPEANVVVMFHRYHENDIAGYLMERGDWEVICFPAIADGDLFDPTGRERGELLSPFHTLEVLLAKQAGDPKTFAGQFQGKPIAEGERMFEPWMFEDRFLEPTRVPSLRTWYRGVDTAMSDKAYADCSATARVAFDDAGNLYLRGFGKRRLTPGPLVDWMETMALRESRVQPWICEMQTNGSAVADRLMRLGFPVVRQKVQGAQGGKRERAFTLHTLAYARKVYIVKEGQWEDFMQELWSFTGDPKLGETDDLIDAVSVVLTYLKEVPSQREDVNNMHIARIREITAARLGG